MLFLSLLLIIAINANGTSYQTGGALTDKTQVIYDPEEQKTRGAPLKVSPLRFQLCTAVVSHVVLDSSQFK